MGKGKLIVIEAGDGAGKATQTALLYEKMSQNGINVRRVSFPNYESPAAEPIKMYLRGDFGAHPGDVNPYAAATFYAVDRFASYKRDWQNFYLSGGVILADRYVTSNMAHQAIKIGDADERQAFLTWLDDLEYKRLALPRPDLVLFLDMEPAAAQKLRQGRKEKVMGDIHESDESYLVNCYAAYKELAERQKWTSITCSRNGTALSAAEIHAAIYPVVQSVLSL